MNYDGKAKIFRQFMGRRNHTKKAIVTLKQGQSIDLASGAKA
jgi:ribosomal protein L23